MLTEEALNLFISSSSLISPPFPPEMVDCVPGCLPWSQSHLPIPGAHAVSSVSITVSALSQLLEALNDLLLFFFFFLILKYSLEACCFQATPHYDLTMVLMEPSDSRALANISKTSSFFLGA